MKLPWLKIKSQADSEVAADLSRLQQVENDLRRSAVTADELGLQRLGTINAILARHTIRANQAADEQANRIERLTWWIMVLTVVIALDAGIRIVPHVKSFLLNLAQGSQWSLRFVIKVISDSIFTGRKI